MRAAVKAGGCFVGEKCSTCNERLCRVPVCDVQKAYSTHGLKLAFAAMRESIIYRSVNEFLHPQRI